MGIEKVEVYVVFCDGCGSPLNSWADYDSPGEALEWAISAGWSNTDNLLCPVCQKEKKDSVDNKRVQ